MKSILKKKPKFLKRESDESSEENACKTNRESFQTVCLADLNESIGSKSQKTQRFSSSEEENYSVKPVKLNNPVKIHLKLDDLLNFESVYNNNQIITNKNMKNNKEIAFFKKNENLTTSDTSKEDLTKIKMFKQGINVKNESISSSSISDYHKISDIVHCNVDLQKIHKEKRKKKGNEGSSSQFNHISEEASEMNN